jgi:hypothetical protein
LSAEDALRPIVIETHISAAGKQEGRGAKLHEGNDTEEKDESEEVVARAK